MFFSLFYYSSPQCELRITLIHSFDGVAKIATHLLKRAMPLTHLKILFCEQFNIATLEVIAEFYSETFQSLIWVDSMDTSDDFTGQADEK